MAEQAVYTALLGGYEELLEQPVAKESTVPFICLTDDPDLTSETWQVVQVTPTFAMDTIRSARRLKILGDPALAEYDETLWIDNTVLLEELPESLLAGWLGDHDLAAPLHSFRASVIAEAEAVIDDGRDDTSVVYEQLLAYLRHHPEVMQRMPFWTAILARRRSPAVDEAMQTWWEHVLRFSRRDQISFPVAVRDLAINAVTLDNKTSPLHKWPRAVGRATRPPAVGHALRPDASEVGRLQNELDRLAFESLGAVNQRELHIADLDAQLESERAVSAALRGQISDLTGEIANLREQLANVKNELDEMQASTSWRVSAPVRLIGGVTRRKR